MDEQPVACSLRPGEFADRSEAWRRLLSGWLVRRVPTPEGGRLVLARAPGVADAVRELAALEADCCPWMAIDVGGGEQVVLTMASDEPGGPETIRELFGISG